MNNGDVDGKFMQLLMKTAKKATGLWEERGDLETATEELSASVELMMKQPEEKPKDK